ncbi:MAG: potassium channel family protein [Candidatus Rifleibacteriota bacterium]
MKNKGSGFRLLIALFLYFALLWVLSLVESVNESSNIKCFSDALWYSLVTLTTVGYGDFYPITPIGKFLALLLIIGSLGVLGYIIGKATEFISDIQWRKKMGFYGTDFEKHIVVVGWNNFAKSIIKDLVHADKRIAIITDDKNDIDLINTEFPSENIFCLFSDLKNSSLYEKANINKSAIVFVNLTNDTEKLISMLNIKKEYPRTRFIVALDNSDLANTFYSAGAEFVLTKNEIASKLMASYIFEPDVADLTNDLLTISEKSEDYDIKEYKITDTNPLKGKTYGEVFKELKEKHNVLPIGLCKCDKEGRRQLYKLPADELKIDAGDYLILIMSGREQNEMSKLFKIAEGVL